MLVYRIVHQLYSNTLVASGIKGRWNSAGKKVIYASESIALAFLESMIRRQGVGFNRDFKIMIIEVAPKAVISEIDINDLDKDWRNINDYSLCQPLGDKWYDVSKSLILKVPSSILPQLNNYVINATHAQFKQVKLIAVTDLVPDNRIEDILKRYSKN